MAENLGNVKKFKRNIVKFRGQVQFFVKYGSELEKWLLKLLTKNVK